MRKFRRSLITSRWYVLVAIVALAVAQGCDSDSAEGTQPLIDAAGDPGTSDAAPQDVSGDLGTSDTSADARDGGEDQSCPLYQSRCDGACIPTSTDPDNCGGCGVTCGADQACSGGTCTDVCMTGLSICDRRCVDLEADSDHCGSCGNTCPTGQGCVEGTCAQAANLGDRGEACAGGGPAIDLGDTVSVERQCSGELAERTFRWALCSCEDIGSTGELYADAYDSSTGVYVRGGEGGGIASNGVVQTTTGVTTTGTLWASDQAADGTAINFTGVAEVGQRVHAGSAIQLNQGMSIGDDAYVNGDFSSNGAVDIGGTLYVPDSATVASSVTSASVTRGPVDVAAPCGECAAEDRIPVGDIVAAHSADNNDNAAIGLDPDIFTNSGDGSRRIDLPCGNFYLSEISTNAGVTIVAHGNTALYIGGDIDSTGQVTITSTPEAQLDVFVAGSVQTNAGLSLGSPNYPALLRVYVGGADGFNTTSGSRIAGFLYAVPGGITTTAGMEVFGGVYGQSLQTTGGGEIHFDRHINMVGEACPGGSPTPDPGVCATQSDACETSADCCSPLVCGADGECALLECKPLHDECVSHDECCSGACGGICVGQ